MLPSSSHNSPPPLQVAPQPSAICPFCHRFSDIYINAHIYTYQYIDIYKHIYINIYIYLCALDIFANSKPSCMRVHACVRCERGAWGTWRLSIKWPFTNWTGGQPMPEEGPHTTWWRWLGLCLVINTCRL